MTTRLWEREIKGVARAGLRLRGRGCREASGESRSSQAGPPLRRRASGLPRRLVIGPGSYVCDAEPGSGRVRAIRLGGQCWGCGPEEAAMSCTIEKILTDAKTLLERLREHDAAAESLVDQSAALHRRVAAMREAGTALPDQVRQRVGVAALRFWALERWKARSAGNSAWNLFLVSEGGGEISLRGRG